MKTKIISSLLAVAILASSVPVYAMEATESIEPTESVEETETIESTESTDSVEEGTTEETVEDTESIDSEDLATSTEETTEEVESTEELEVYDEMTMGYYDSFETVGHENLVVGKTYKFNLSKNQYYYLNNIPSSSENDQYAAVLTVDDATHAVACLFNGTYTDVVTLNRAMYNGTYVDFTGLAAEGGYVDENIAFCEIPNFSGSATMEIHGNGTFEFTIVRLPSEVPDKDKVNIIPNADGTVTCKWQPTSDCDGMYVVVKEDGNNKLLDKKFDKSITEYTFDPKTENSMWISILPYVLAGNKDIYGDLQWILTDNITPVTIKAIEDPIVNVYESYLETNGQWVKVYDETGKRIYNGVDIYMDVLRDKLHKYAGETLKVVAYNEVNTKDGQGNKITLRSKGSKPVYVDIPFDTGAPEWNCRWEGSNGNWGISCCDVYGAEKYEVQYKLGKNSKWKKLVTSKDGDIDLKNTKPGVYYYRFRCTTTTSSGKTLTTKWSKSYKVEIKPSKVKGIKATSKKTKKTPQATVSWKKQSGVTGYEVYVSTSKNGKFYKVKSSVTSTSKTYKGKVTCTVKGKNKTIKLKSGKTYYFKVRAYKESPGSKTLYGGYSSVTKVKIK